MNWMMLTIAMTMVWLTSIISKVLLGGTIERRPDALGDIVLFLMFVPANYFLWKGILL